MPTVLPPIAPPQKKSFIVAAWKSAGSNRQKILWASTWMAAKTTTNQLVVNYLPKNPPEPPNQRCIKHNPSAMSAISARKRPRRSTVRMFIHALGTESDIIQTSGSNAGCAALARLIKATTRKQKPVFAWSLFCD